MQLDGTNDFVGLGNPAALQLTGSMTVSAWINSATFPGDDAAIVSKRTSGEVGYQLDTTVDRGPRTIGFKLTTARAAECSATGRPRMQANTWYHVTGVYNAATSELHVYLNGQLDDGTLLGTVTADPAELDRQRQHRPAPDRGAFNFNGRSTTSASTQPRSTQAEIQTDMDTHRRCADTRHAASDRANRPTGDGAELDSDQPLLEPASDNVV